MIRIGLFKHADEAFSSRDVYALPAGVVTRIVSVLNARKYGNRFPAVGIENGQARWLMRGNEEPVIRFIQGHREIVFQGHGPANDDVSLSVDHRNLFQVRQIHVKARARDLQLKRLRMRAQVVFFRQPFVRCGIDGADRPRFVFSIANVHAPIRRVVAQIVNVTVEINGLDQTKSSAFIDVELPFAAGGKKLLELRRVDRSLWIRDASDAVAADTGADVDNFHTVVPPRAATINWFFPSKPKWSKRPWIPGMGIASVKTSGRGGSGAKGS